MSKKASKKKTSKKVAAKPAAKSMEKAFFDAVRPVVAAGFAEPTCTQHTKLAWRRFKENLETS